MEKFIVPLKPCPWCKKCPNMTLCYDDTLETNGTWKWDIYCANDSCNVQPKTKHVSIRKLCKRSTVRMKVKICMLAGYWNDGNNLEATEGKVIDLVELIGKYYDTLL